MAAYKIRPINNIRYEDIKIFDAKRECHRSDISNCIIAVLFSIGRLPRKVRVFVVS